jgi:hypothetical protein
MMSHSGRAFFSVSTPFCHPCAEDIEYHESVEDSQILQTCVGHTDVSED